MTQAPPRPGFPAVQSSAPDSTAQPNHITTYRKPKRQKIQVACQECRDRKIRCDGGRPTCDSCLRKNLSPGRCVYFHTTNSSPNPYVRRLEQRIHELESSNGQVPDHSTRQSNAVAPLRNPADSNSTRYPNNLPHNHRLPLQDSSVERTPLATREVEFDSAPSQVETPLFTSKSDNGEAQSNESPAYLGSSSAVGFMAEVYQTFGTAGNRASREREVSVSTSTPSRPGTTSWLASLRSEPASLMSSASELMIPPKHIADRLVDSYWIGAHPLQPVIHRRTFTRRYNRLWSNDGSEDSLRSPETNIPRCPTRLFHCMLNTVLVLGCRFWSISHPHDAAIPASNEQHFLHQAEKLLNLQLLDEPSIELVQTLLLMIQCLQNLGLSNKTWVLTGMAIRVAQAIGLHLNVDGESQERREERRKAWAICVVLDRVQSMTFGRPLMLDSAVEFFIPQVVDEEFLSVDPAAPDEVQPPNVPARIASYVQILKLSNITADILRLSYHSVNDQATGDRRVSDYNSLFNVENDLERWHDELPEFLQYDRIAQDSKPQDLFVRQAHLLQHRYLHAKILLFRRVVVRLAAKSLANNPSSSLGSVEKSMAMSCIEVCTSAAQSLLDTIFPHIGTKLVPPAWFTIFLIYTAGTVLVVVFLTPSFLQSLSSEQIDCLRQSWTRCIECLEIYQNQGAPSALPCLRNLRSLYRTDGPNVDDGYGHERATGDRRRQSNAPPKPGQVVQPEDDQLMDPQLLGPDISDPWSIGTPTVWWPEDLFDSFMDLALPGR